MTGRKRRKIREKEALPLPGTMLDVLDHVINASVLFEALVEV